MSATKLRVLRAACDAAGGAAALAEHLGVSEPMLRKYMNGVFPLPDPLFLRAVDYVLVEREPHPPVSSAVAPAPLDPRQES